MAKEKASKSVKDDIPKLIDHEVYEVKLSSDPYGGFAKYCIEPRSGSGISWGIASADTGSIAISEDFVRKSEFVEKMVEFEGRISFLLGEIGNLEKELMAVKDLMMKAIAVNNDLEDKLKAKDDLILYLKKLKGLK